MGISTNQQSNDLDSKGIDFKKIKTFPLELRWMKMSSLRRLFGRVWKGQIKQSKDEVEDDGNFPKVNPPRSMCGGSNSEIEHGRSVGVLSVLWHPECLWCDACHKLIVIHEENYCPVHESDETSKRCSCKRLEL
ncbi:hypothetical protein AALP_AA4G140800 [Arabis alpina]|uniref:LIM zinc-binding domain-containing protein n=1 Tax=Arabis alpina TaxID=50452 RepID=A0A087H369_ARAAL|nr:hypothetical protein AALP_AA4G140800 [Arabis alpina]